MGEYEKKIRKLVKALETEAAAAIELREFAKTEGGRLDGFGRDIVAAGKEHDIPQAAIARILDVDPSVISRRYAALEEE